MVMARIRALVVDDEALARERVQSLLQKEPDVECVGACANGPEAVAAVAELTPDLVFLDVQMPGLDGFGVVEAVGPDKMPAVVFVTAYDRYALRAFEIHALDYLLKPFDRPRFQKTLQRVRDHLALQKNNGVEERLAALLDDVQATRKPMVDRLVIKSAGRVTFVKADEVDWVEAAGNYARVHVGKEEHLIRETMNALEAKLDPAKFVRIHRSTIINLERVRELQPWFHGDYVVILKDGKQLTLSRGYKPKMHELFGNLF